VPRPSAPRLALPLAVALSTPSCGGSSTPPATTQAGAPLVSYEASLRADGTLEVVVRDPDGALAQATIEEGAEVHLLALEVQRVGLAAGESSEAPRRRVDARSLPIALPECASGCVVRYTLDLRAIARDFQNPQFGFVLGEDLVMPVTSFLLRPTGEAPPGRFVLTFAEGAPAGRRFVSGLAADADGRFSADLADLPQAPYGAFTRSDPISVASGVRVVRLGPEPALGDAAVHAWVDEAARDVAGYLGTFDAKPLVLVLVEEGDDVGMGYSLGNGGASVLVGLGRDAPAAVLERDWVMTHELLHTSMPSLSSRHNWMEEGFATYAEPVARVKRGRLSEERVFREWQRAMWQGQPRDDAGLDGTRSWGRLYWGGAGFWFAAELAVHEATGGAKTLADCFGAVTRASRGIADRWSVERFLTACDAGLGAPVVRPLYERMAREPVALPFDEMFARLGVTSGEAGVELTSEAPLASCRAAVFGGAKTR
jgi:hypothetical protein